MKQKIGIGIVLGMIAGIIDVIPMIAQQLSWYANISAFAMWVICGFFISTTDLKMHPLSKGLLISFLCATPVIILIAGSEPFSLIPIFIMTTLLGSALGIAIDKILKKLQPE